MRRILFLLIALAFRVVQAFPVPIYSVTAQNHNHPAYAFPTNYSITYAGGPSDPAVRTVGLPYTVSYTPANDDLNPSLVKPNGRQVKIIGLDPSVSSILALDPNATPEIAATTAYEWGFVPWTANGLGQVVGRDWIDWEGLGGYANYANRVILVQPDGSSKILATGIPGANDSDLLPICVNLLGVTAGCTISEYWDTTYQNPIWDNGQATIYYQGKSIGLGSLQPTNAYSSRPGYSAATAINDLGVVVGVTGTVKTGVYVGFVYLNRKMYDLNTLVNGTGQGLKITSANNINDFGQILATAVDTTGASHPVVLTVVGYSTGSNVLK
jgi:probable HAF family extracellular repeat protein